MPTQPTKNTYSLYIDWDYAGSGTPDFTQANDNITAYVMGFDGLLGNQKPLLTQMATVGNGAIKLNNDSRRFSPKNASGALYGKLLAITGGAFSTASSSNALQLTIGTF